MKGGGSRTNASLLSWFGNGLIPVAPGANLGRDSQAILNGAPNAARPGTFYPCTAPGFVRRLFIHTDLPVGAGVDVNFVVYKNEVATSIVVNIAGAAETNDSDLTNVVEVATGDRLHLHADRGAGVPPNLAISAVLEFVRRN